VYRGTGLERFFLSCADESVPVFTLDPAQQPEVCGDGAIGLPVVQTFDPSFRFPRNVRLALGGDTRLPWGLVGTADLLFVHGVDQLALKDINLRPAASLGTGEGGRVLYGTADADGLVPNRISPAFGPVVVAGNAGGDRAFSATLQLQLRLVSRGHLALAYTYTDSKDRLSPTCEDFSCDLAVTPLDGRLESRRLAPSRYSVPHKVTAAATFDVPLKFRVGLFYIAFSGEPYSYMVTNDVNGDEIDGNDLVYLPLDQSDIALDNPAQFAVLDSVIQSQECLRKQRGAIMGRNSCRDHWNTLLNARVSRLFSTAWGHNLELILDLFNVLNFLDSDWGAQRRVARDASGGAALLEATGYDAEKGRARYIVLPVDRRVLDSDATRWRLQLGARYAF
jgi:hypothetical protein